MTESPTLPALSADDWLALDLVDPTDPATAAAHALAPRAGSLRSLRVALLDNRKGNANHLLTRLGDSLRAAGAADVTLWSKPIFSRPAPDPLIAEIAARCDVVVTAIGD